MKLIEYLLMEAEGSSKDKSKKKEHPHTTAQKLANRKVAESSSQVSQLIKGRHSIDMKAFGKAREKDPASVVGSLGVKGGAGWNGILNVVNSLAGAKGLGQVIAGAQLINNGGNVEDEKPSYWIVQTPGNYCMPGFDWSTYSKEIGNAKKIRMSI